MVLRAALRIFALGFGSMGSAFAASAPDLPGYMAVPQVWSITERFVFAPDRRWLASVSDEGRRVQIVDNATGTILRTLVATGRHDEERSDLPAGIAITGDSKVVVVRLVDGTEQAWNAGTGEALATPPAGVTFAAVQPWEDSAPGAYRIAATTDREGIETVSITSGSKHIDPVRLQVSEKTIHCGIGVAEDAIFDGEELVFSHRQGQGSALAYDDILPAIAYRLDHGTFHELWRAPCQNGFVWSWFSADGAHVVQTDGPVGPTKVWNLAANRVVASFKASDGLFAASADDGTMVASTFEDSGDREKTFTLLHRGTRRSFPRPAEFSRLVLSPNGRWLAASASKTTSVWSLPDGVLRTTKPVEASAISNEGVVSDRKTWMGEDFHDHEIVEASHDGRWLITNGGAIFDKTSGRIVAEGRGFQHVSDEGRVTGQDGDGSLRTLDLSTGRTLSTVQQEPNGDGYIMSFSDGCVQVSPGADKFVRLVRGFESRAFDGAARKAFTRPGCKGMPAAIAASEAAFAAERARVAAIAKTDADEQERLKREADEEARRAEAARQAWIAGAPARDSEARRAARMVSEATITLATATGSETRFSGQVAWHLSKSARDADAAGVIRVPGVAFEAILAIDKAPPSEPEGTGVIAIAFHPPQKPLDARSPSVAAIGSTAASRSPSPSHIALHLGGPSYLPHLARLDPAAGGVELASLKPSTWLDVPLMLADGQAATLSIAIGDVGRQVIDDVVAFKKIHP